MSNSAVNGIALMIAAVVGGLVIGGIGYQWRKQAGEWTLRVNGENDERVIGEQAGQQIKQLQGEAGELKAVYTGFLPSRKSQGVETTVALWSEGKSEQSGEYLLTERYRGVDDNGPMVRVGKWEVKQGTKKEPLAVKYVLNEWTVKDGEKVATDRQTFYKVVIVKGEKQLEWLRGEEEEWESEGEIFEEGENEGMEEEQWRGRLRLVKTLGDDGSSDSRTN
jgi:hypothetical protein